MVGKFGRKGKQLRLGGTTNVLLLKVWGIDILGQEVNFTINYGVGGKIRNLGIGRDLLQLKGKVGKS